MKKKGKLNLTNFLERADFHLLFRHLSHERQKELEEQLAQGDTILLCRAARDHPKIQYKRGDTHSLICRWYFLDQ